LPLVEFLRLDPVLVAGVEPADKCSMKSMSYFLALYSNPMGSLSCVGRGKELARSFAAGAQLLCFVERGRELCAVYPSQNLRLEPDN
jgi:hypothetical protein